MPRRHSRPPPPLPFPSSTSLQTLSIPVPLQFRPIILLLQHPLVLYQLTCSPLLLPCNTGAIRNAIYLGM
ncbi:hypothetical protein LX32DRAFT_646269 [Colletotrichum zoysiae]|uniref:Uncharacterized protein n=1 Tax=Colletotrichum zoysiae TaxID=1216348 RepID=A0AAD9H525_9PEZI|nr:hypothetical protein LX32DRAFT_646269 [Colletotrichum zoysiae]